MAVRRNPGASRAPLLIAALVVVAVLALGWFLFLRDDDDDPAAGGDRVVRIEATDGACWSAVLPVQGEAQEDPQRQDCGSAELRLPEAGPAAITKANAEGTLTVVGLADNQEVSRETLTDPLSSTTVDPQAGG